MTPAEHRARAEALVERNDVISLEKSHHFPDATGGQVTVLPVKGAPGVILSFADDAALLENPDVLRTLASLLTAHADRLESKP